MRLMILITLILLAGPAYALGQGQPQLEREKPEREKRVCKKIYETGSLVKAKKVCLTTGQWNKVRDDAQRLSRNIVEAGTGKTFE